MEIIIKYKSHSDKPRKIGDKLHMTNDKWYEIVEINNNYGVELTLLELRTYGSWAGNEAGKPEDRTKCIENVYPSRTWIPQQCSFKRGKGKYGLYCGIHAKNNPEES